MACSSKRVLSISLLLAVNAIIVYLVFVKYRTDLSQAIEHAAIRMRSMPYSPLLMTLITCICSIPPLFGFAFSVSMSGYIYGFPQGCPPAIAGAFLGAILSFVLIRKLRMYRWIKLSRKKQEHFGAMSNAISATGARMVLLIRISPIPWQVSNLILVLCKDVGFKTYSITAFVTAFKVCWEVWLGSQLATLNDPTLPPQTHKFTFVSLSVGLLLLGVLGIWLYKLTMKKVKENQNDEVMAPLLLPDQEQQDIAIV